VRSSSSLVLLVFCAAAPLAAQVSVTRTDVERPRIEAVEARGVVRVDGVLDDEAWQRAVAVTDFTQAEPLEGQPSTERTEVRIAWDGENLYIAAYLHDSEPGALVVTDIKKDFAETEQDAFSVILDTFRDRRNGYVFMTNPEGARADQQVANEGREINASWECAGKSCR